MRPLSISEGKKTHSEPFPSDSLVTSWTVISILQGIRIGPAAHATSHACRNISAHKAQCECPYSCITEPRTEDSRVFISLILMLHCHSLFELDSVLNIRYGCTRWRLHFPDSRSSPGNCATRSGVPHCPTTFSHPSTSIEEGDVGECAE